MSLAATPLAEALDGWAPGPVHSARRVDPWPAAAFPALLDTAPPPLEPGDPLPPLWHWFTLHYDQPYALAEGYPGLVVHGPLLALLALELPRRHTPEPVTAFAYRLVRPAFAGAVVEATARCSGGDLDLVVGVDGSGPSLTATAALGPVPEPSA